MKTVIFEYGKSVLAVVVALLILGIVGVTVYSGSSENGILGQIEEQANQSGSMDGAREKSSIYQIILERNKPVITYRAAAVYADVLPDWDNMFFAEDEDGKQLEVQIMKINGNKEQLPVYCFPESGIYEIEVAAQDDYGVRTYQMFQIPVQRASLGKEQEL